MEPCQTCDALMEVVKIDSPRRLREVAESLLPHLRDQRIEQISGDGSPADIARQQWGDIVSLVFRCTRCGTRYVLAAETNHGQGGVWRRLSEDENAPSLTGTPARRDPAFTERLRVKLVGGHPPETRTMNTSPRCRHRETSVTRVRSAAPPEHRDSYASVRSEFTIIDHFRVTETLAARLGLPIGTWFVVEPGVQSVDQLPGIGTPLLIKTPNGDTLRALVSDRAVRHGSAAFRFGDPELNDLPRLSVVAFAA